jgi:hypothetical protein
VAQLFFVSIRDGAQTEVCKAWLLDSRQLVQAAIDMANVELKYGTYQPLLVLAKEIIAAQTEEIGEFRTILAKDYSTPMSATAVGGK